MRWKEFYQPPDPSLWCGREDSAAEEYVFQIIQCHNLLQQQPPSIQSTRFALLGFCSEEGVLRNQGRAGAAAGPAAIRQQFARLAWQQASVAIFDFGDILCREGDLESAQQAMAELVAQLQQQGYITVLLGGGHEIAWAHYQGLAHAHTELAVFNLDAHLDMRPLLADNKGSSGTPFRQIAHWCEKNNREFIYACVGLQTAANTASLWQEARRRKVHTVLAETVHAADFSAEHLLQSFLPKSSAWYLTICLDVLAAAFAPGVSAPQALGLFPHQVRLIIQQLAQSGKVTGYDIAELSPALDSEQRTARLAANFLLDIVTHHRSSP